MFEFAPLFGILLFFAYLLVPTGFFSGGGLNVSSPAGSGKWGVCNRFIDVHRTSSQMEPEATDGDVPPFETVVERARVRKSLRKGISQKQATIRGV